MQIQNNINILQQNRQTNNHQRQSTIQSRQAFGQIHNEGDAWARWKPSESKLLYILGMFITLPVLFVNFLFKSKDSAANDN